MSAFDQIKALASEKETGHLLLALAMLDSKPEPTPEERMVVGAMCSVIEDRHPALDSHMEGWALLEWGTELSYAQALVVAMHKARVNI